MVFTGLISNANIAGGVNFKHIKYWIDMEEKKLPQINQDRVIANQVSGMPLEEAIFQDGYSSGVEFEKNRDKTGAVWVKGDYDRLYDQVKGGKRTVCYVDYNPWGTGDVYRDICTIKPESMEFTSRGHCYGSSKYLSGHEKELFIELCESINVEWLDESGQSKEPVSDHALYETRLALRMLLQVFKSMQKTEEQERYYTQAECMLKKHGRIADVLRAEGTVAGSEEDGVALLRWLNESEWSPVGNGEYINHSTQRIIKEEKLYQEFKQQKEK